MKKLLPILLFITSCSKEPYEPKPGKPTQFTATVSINPTNQTIYYDMYVSNDPANRNDSFMIWAGRFTKEQMRTYPFMFGFDFTGYVCNEFTVTPGKKLYGATRETVYGNIQMELDYNSVTIK